MELKILNKIALLALFTFVFASFNIQAQCVYDDSQMDMIVEEISAEIVPFGGQTGEFYILWKEADEPDCEAHSCGLECDDSGQINAPSFTINDLEPCTDYAFCISEKCGPDSWSEPKWFCFTTECCNIEDCVCDDEIVINPEAGIRSETSVYLYANSYVGVPHYFIYRPINPTRPWQSTTISYEYYSTITDLKPCTEYEYQLIVYCPEDCDDCDWTQSYRISETHYFNTPGCHEPPLDSLCCDYLFIVDKSGSMSDADLLEVECEIQNFIDSVQTVCDSCSSSFAITTFGQVSSQSEVVTDFGCDPEVDLGETTSDATNVGNGLEDVVNWLNDDTLNPPSEGEDQCLRAIIYTDAACSEYGDFSDAIGHLTQSGVDAVSLVAYQNHDCEGIEGLIEGTGGTYTTSDPGDCEGHLDPDNTARNRSSDDGNIEIDYNNLLESDKNKTSFTSTVTPNPFNNNFNINLTSENDEAYQLTIFNHQGRLILEISGNLMKGQNTIAIDQLSKMPSGIYFYQLNTDTNQYSNKIVKY